jgi:AraC-like DNA-binding protein
MIYREHALPAAACRAAFCAWSFALERHDPETVVHSIPPDGTGNLLLARAPDGVLTRRLVGPSLSAQIGPVHRGWRFAGLRLRPECVAAVTGRDPAALVGTSAPAEGPEPLFAALAGLVECEERWELDEAGANLLASHAGDPAVAAAVDLLVASGGTASIEAAAACVRLSPRQLRRRFAAATGLSPKQYACVQRVRRALILSLHGGSWAGVAADSGFADQPHLSRAIRAAFHTAPRTIGGYIGGIRHEFVEPAGGRFVQDGNSERA